MNLKLKSHILENSINIEDGLTNILKTLLGVEEVNNKTLGYKGTALSFRTKADLLYDIGKISKETYSELIIFMEVRNQFIHNLDTNSFEIVLERIGKKSQMLDFFDSSNNQSVTDNEAKYSQGFISLTMKLLKDLQKTHETIFEEKINAVKEKLGVIGKQREAETLDLALGFLGDSIDESMELLSKRFKEVFNYDGDFGNTIKNWILGNYQKKWEDEERKRKNES